MRLSGQKVQLLIGLYAHDIFVILAETNVLIQTFEDARKTGDKILQESIAFTYVFSC